MFNDCTTHNAMGALMPKKLSIHQAVPIFFPSNSYLLLFFDKFVFFYFYGCLTFSVPHIPLCSLLARITLLVCRISLNLKLKFSQYPSIHINYIIPVYHLII